MPADPGFGDLEIALTPADGVLTLDEIELVGLAIPERALHGTDFSLLRALLVNLVAAAALEVAEVFAEPLVRVDDAKVAVLHGKIARHAIEVLSVDVFHHASPEVALERG